MGKHDAGLRKILISAMPAGQWTPVETGVTAQGVPDAEFCFGPPAVQGWVECKRTLAWSLEITPEQVGWHLRRARHGGRTLIAVRRLNRGSDELWLHRGRDASLLARGGLRAASPLGVWEGGPGGWDWVAVRGALCGPLD